jgi:hypothetical protein
VRRDWRRTVFPDVALLKPSAPYALACAAVTRLLPFAAPSGAYVFQSLCHHRRDSTVGHADGTGYEGLILTTVAAATAAWNYSADGGSLVVQQVCTRTLYHLPWRHPLNGRCGLVHNAHRFMVTFGLFYWHGWRRARGRGSVYSLRISADGMRLTRVALAFAVCARGCALCNACRRHTASIYLLRTQHLYRFAAYIVAAATALLLPCCRLPCLGTVAYSCRMALTILRLRVYKTFRTSCRQRLSFVQRLPRSCGTCCISACDQSVGVPLASVRICIAAYCSTGLRCLVCASGALPPVRGRTTSPVTPLNKRRCHHLNVLCRRAQVADKQRRQWLQQRYPWRSSCYVQNNITPFCCTFSPPAPSAPAVPNYPAVLGSVPTQDRILLVYLRRGLLHATTLPHTPPHRTCTPRCTPLPLRTTCAAVGSVSFHFWRFNPDWFRCLDASATTRGALDAVLYCWYGFGSSDFRWYLADSS